MTVEIWKPAPRYEGWYEVSNLGRARRIKSGRNTTVGRILALQIHKDGYVFVDFCKNGVQKHHLLSRLVCEAFHGPCPSGQECNHKGEDGDKSNNRADNLEWGTHSDNCKHKYEVLKHSLANFRAANPWVGKKGKKHPSAKHYIVTSPKGREIDVVGLKHFCRENNLHFGAMVQIATGSGHSHKHRGWKCRYA